MIYLLDTNAAIALLKEHPQMLNHVRRAGQSTLRVCAHRLKLSYGLAWPRAIEKNRIVLVCSSCWSGCQVYLLRINQRSILATSAPIWQVKAHRSALMICRLQPLPLPTI